MPIYQPQQEPLQDIVSRAINGTLMIPDLQRNYVWQPFQTIRLIDSLLRGWPYSTLLFWNTGLANNHNELIPHHAYRRTLSRLPSGLQDNPQVNFFPGANIPGNILMTLDGQQRLQSLLIAFGAEDAGLYLLDKDWMSDFSENGDHPYRGNAVNQRWMFGKLYLDLEKLFEKVIVTTVTQQYTLPREVNFQDLFRWACPEGNAHIGGPPRQDGYQWPLDRLTLKNPGGGRNRYIRASLIWDAARGYNNLDEDEKTNKISYLLNSQGADCWDNDDNYRRILSGIIRLVSIVAEVQMQNIPYFLLNDTVTAGYSDKIEKYREAIVNIFTRLNAAGMVLDAEEITFAWLKNRWDQLRLEDANNLHPHGSKIAEELSRKFEDAVKLNETQVIRLFSHLWSCFDGSERDYRLLSASDLLNGTQIQSMAEWLYCNWNNILRSVGDVKNALLEIQFLYPHHYKSINILYALLIYRYGQQMLSSCDSSVTNIECCEKYKEDILKWMGISIFGGLWARNSDSDLQNFVKSLGRNWDNPGTRNFESWRNAFIGFIKEDTIQNSLSYIDNFECDKRSYVKSRPLLAIWNHCDQDRNNFCRRLSQASDQLTNNRVFRCQIDHISPKREWDNLVDRFCSMQGSEKDLIKNKVHQIGNLMELDPSDNPSKNNKSISVWLDKYEQTLRDMNSYFSIEDIHSESIIEDEEDLNRLVEVIDTRSSKIKDDVKSYLKQLF